MYIYIHIYIFPQIAGNYKGSCFAKVKPSVASFSASCSLRVLCRQLFTVRWRSLAKVPSVPRAGSPWFQDWEALVPTFGNRNVFVQNHCILDRHEHMLCESNRFVLLKGPE